MNCASCVQRVQRVLDGVSGVTQAQVNLANESAEVAFSGSGIGGTIIKALTDAGYPAATQNVTFAVKGMNCASCVGRVERALSKVSGVTDVQVNLANETAIVQYVPGITSIETLARTAGDAGYPVDVADVDNTVDYTSAKASEAIAHRNAMYLAAALTLPVFILEMGGHLFPSWHHLIARSIGHSASWMIQFVLTTLVLIGPGRGFFVKGFAAVLRRAPTMDSLVALGAGAAWAYSTFALFLPNMMPHGSAVVYFEAAAVIVTLILLGRWFEARAKGQTGAAIQTLIGLQPRTARVKRGEDWREVPLAELVVGDVILIRPGARIPIDAMVLSGESDIDESMITGEPMPQLRGPGAALTGGTVNGLGSLTGEVTRVGQDTTLAQIVRLVQQAQGARLPIQGLVDRITMWFVPAVLAVAALTVVIWLAFGPEPILSHALVAAVSVLIIACPCAMGLATPTSIMVGTGRAAQLGVLFRQGDALQTLSGIDVVAFDKTGTLTQGKPTLTTFRVAAGRNPEDVLRQIAAVEALSEHPLGKAIVDAAAQRDLALATISAFQSVSGMGVTALIDGQTVAIGNAALMAQQGADTSEFEAEAAELAQTGQIVFFAAIGDEVAALIAVSDPIKPDAFDTVKVLKEQGVEVAMITGDGAKTAQAVAQSLGIERFIAGVLPEGKVAALEELRRDIGKVAFVGDGINDAPALAHADIGIALGTGTDVAIETADVVLMSGDVSGVRRAMDVSRLTLKNIRQNLVWAFGYNIVLIPVAAGVLFPAFAVLLSPGLAAGAMACSSVFVLANALRLRRVGARV